jgi:hypothetical protein
MVRFAVMSGSAPLVEAAGCAASSRPRVTVFAPESIISGGDNRPFLLQFQFFGHTTGKMAKNVTCKYRITATVKADTTYELEVIKENLIRAGANILHIDPITIVVPEERPDPPKRAA